MSSLSVSTQTSRLYTPSDMEALAQAIIQHLKSLRVWSQNRVAQGAGLAAPSTPSSQLTGTGNTTWQVNVGLIQVVVNGLFTEVAAAADFSIHSGSHLMANGLSCIAAIVAKNVSGTITVVAVKGTPATTGTQLPPSDAVIQAAVGAANSWIKIGHVTLNRTGDTTVTESFDNAYRPLLAVNVDSEFGNY